jgi:hypothetical protein
MLVLELAEYPTNTWAAKEEEIWNYTYQQLYLYIWINLPDDAIITV